MDREKVPGCLFFPISWIAALVLGGGLFAGLLIVLNLSKPSPAPIGVVTAALTVIPSLSGTATPIPPEISPTPEISPAPTLAEGEIGVGAFVQVSGTGGDGLRLRQGPGLDFEMQFLGLDGELFQVGDGPVQADGYTWWFVIGSYDDTRQGWAVDSFLVVVPEP
ncbi:MAG TPA: hypothetical protein EYP88_02955 [Anaerolineales bacterium]|nr:hypothetical protein [Anaerolineales bacterium]